MHDIIQWRRLHDIIPLLNVNEAKRRMKYFNFPQKTLKNSAGNPSMPGVFPFFICFKALLNSYIVISCSREFDCSSESFLRSLLNLY